MKGSVILLIAVIIACGGGRPIRYVDYDVMNRGLPIRKSHDYAYADDTNNWVEPFSPAGDTSGTRICTGYFCTWDSHKDVTTEAQQTWIPTESANSGKIICIFLTKKYFVITGVPQATQGSPTEQTTGPVSEASIIPLTGELETRIPRTTYPSSPFETPGPWIFTLLLLSCLGVAGVARACMKGLVPV